MCINIRYIYTYIRVFSNDTRERECRIFLDKNRGKEKERNEKGKREKWIATISSMYNRSTLFDEKKEKKKIIVHENKSEI